MTKFYFSLNNVGNDDDDGDHYHHHHHHHHHHHEDEEEGGPGDVYDAQFVQCKIEQEPPLDEVNPINLQKAKIKWELHDVQNAQITQRPLN